MYKLQPAKQIWILLLCLVISSCAARRTGPPTWRLLNHNSSPLLLPPDLTTPDIASRNFTVTLPVGHAPCPSSSEVIAIQVRGKKALLTVSREALSKQPRGWLSNWASNLESQNCLPPGQASRLAEQITASLPLGPATAYQLLHPDDRLSGTVELGAQDYLMVISPLMKDPGKPIMESETVSGTGLTLNLTAKSTDNLLGYERALYKVQPAAKGIGYRIAAQYADHHIGDTIKRQPQPATNYFQFPQDAAFFRIFYKSGENHFTALIVAARTPDELEKRTSILSSNSAATTCQKGSENMCIVIPKSVAINPVVAVNLNGSEKFLIRGTSLSTAIELTGLTKPESILHRLKITKLWNGQPTAISFDPASNAILKLILQGGETVSWY